MNTLVIILVSLVSALHVGFFIIESFLWTRPLGLRIFRQSSEQAQATKVLAHNQGWYNFLVALGLITALKMQSPEWLYFFLLSVVGLGGIGAGSTRNPRIFFVQSVPAILSLLALIIGG